MLKRGQTTAIATVVALVRSGLAALFVLMVSVGALIAIALPDLEVRERIYLFVGCLSTAILFLSVGSPELALPLLTMSPRGYHLRLLPETDNPVFQFGFWIWLAATIGVSLYLVAKRRSWRLRDLTWPTMFLLWLTTSLLWTPNLGTGLTRTSAFIMDFAVMLLAYGVACSSPERMRAMMAWMLLASVVFALIILVSASLFRGMTVLGFDKNESGRMILVSMPMLSLLRPRQRRLVFALFLVGILASGSRTALFAFAIYLLASVFAERDATQRAARLLTVAGTSIAVLGLLLSLSTYFQQLAYQLIGLKDVMRIIQGAGSSALLTTRLRFRYLEAFLQDVRRPSEYLRGIGIGGYPLVHLRLTGEQQDRASPHLLVAHLYYELGVVGVALFLATVASVFLRSLNTASGDESHDTFTILRGLALCATAGWCLTGSIAGLRMVLFAYGLILGYCSNRESGCSHYETGCPSRQR